MKNSAQGHKKVLVTGAGGAIGRVVVEYLISKANYDLILNYFLETEIPPKVKENKDINIVIGNIVDLNIQEKMFKDIDTIVHLASSVNPKGYGGNWLSAYQFGAESTFAILDYIRFLNKKIHIIFPSSGGTIYSKKQQIPFLETDETNGTSPYGIQKIMFENYLKLLCSQNKNITCNVLRISNPYALLLKNGRQQGFIDVAIDKVLKNEIIEIWSPLNTTRDYIYIDDLSKAIEKAINYTNGYEIFNIGSGLGATLEDILNIISEKINRKIKYEYFSNNFYCTNYNVLNIEKAKTILNWTPEIPLNKGIDLAINMQKEIKCKQLI